VEQYESVNLSITVVMYPTVNVSGRYGESKIMKIYEFFIVVTAKLNYAVMVILFFILVLFLNIMNTLK
jgi:hypothetical protein